MPKVPSQNKHVMNDEEQTWKLGDVTSAKGR